MADSSAPASRGGRPAGSAQMCFTCFSYHCGNDGCKKNGPCKYRELTPATTVETMCGYAVACEQCTEIDFRAGLQKLGPNFSTSECKKAGAEIRLKDGLLRRKRSQQRKAREAGRIAAAAAQGQQPGSTSNGASNAEDSEVHHARLGGLASLRHNVSAKTTAYVAPGDSSNMPPQRNSGAERQSRLFSRLEPTEQHALRHEMASQPLPRDTNAGVSTMRGAACLAAMRAGAIASSSRIGAAKRKCPQPGTEFLADMTGHLSNVQNSEEAQAVLAHHFQRQFKDVKPLGQGDGAPNLPSQFRHFAMLSVEDLQEKMAEAWDNRFHRATNLPQYEAAKAQLAWLEKKNTAIGPGSKRHQTLQPHPELKNQGTQRRAVNMTLGAAAASNIPGAKKAMQGIAQVGQSIPHEFPGLGRGAHASGEVINLMDCSNSPNVALAVPAPSYSIDDIPNFTITQLMRELEIYNVNTAGMRERIELENALKGCMTRRALGTDIGQGVGDHTKPAQPGDACDYNQLFNPTTNMGVWSTEPPASLPSHYHKAFTVSRRPDGPLANLQLDDYTLISVIMSAEESGKLQDMERCPTFNQRVAFGEMGDFEIGSSQEASLSQQEGPIIELL